MIESEKKEKLAKAMEEVFYEYSDEQKAEAGRRLAEMSFKEGHPAVAKGYALTAQRLSPNLPGIHGDILAYDIHLAATRTRPNSTVDGDDDQQPDWHAVLGVPKSANADTIKKRYKKTAALVHPDKNACAAAKGAFKLVTEAKTHLLEAIQIRKERETLKGRRFGGNSATPDGENGRGTSSSCNNASSGSSRPRKRTRTRQAPAAAGGMWTMCYWCKAVYGTESSWVNSPGRCLNCNKEFVMIDGDAVVRAGSLMFGWTRLRRKINAAATCSGQKQSSSS